MQNLMRYVKEIGIKLENAEIFIQVEKSCAPDGARYIASSFTWGVHSLK